MDFEIKADERSRKLKYLFLVLAGLLFGIGVLVSWIQLKPALPEVLRAEFSTGRVCRGQLTAVVQGAGLLVPKESWLISADIEGKVICLHCKPGDRVMSGVVLLDLGNPNLEQSVSDAQLQLAAAENEMVLQQSNLDNRLLELRATLAATNSEYRLATLDADRNLELAENRLLSDSELKRSMIHAEELSTRFQLEKQKLEAFQKSIQIQLSIYRSRLDQIKVLLQSRLKQMQMLHVTLDAAGIVQDVMVQEGQWVSAGTKLARIADPATMHAEVKIWERQAVDVRIGLPVEVDIAGRITEGKISGIEPFSKNGSVLVSVDLLSTSAPENTIGINANCAIITKRLEGALHLATPAGVKADSEAFLYRLSEDGLRASRTKVRLGLCSVNQVEVVTGLSEGDEVILSDMTSWIEHPLLRVR